MTKSDIRKIYREKRMQLSWQQMDKWNDLLLINFQQLNLPFINCVHTYLAMEEQNEIDTSNIIRYLAFANPELKTVVPKINLDRGEMRHYIYNEEVTMATNAFGIIEPVNGVKAEAAEIDLVLTPLLCFDRQGYRVGYGKGFYDRFFRECRPGTIRVGLSYFAPVDSIEDIKPFDIALHHCITPEKLYTF